MTVLSNAADKATLPLHGRRLGLIGDGQAANSSLLQVDNVPVGSTRSGVPAIPFMATMLNAAGAITLTGAVGSDLSPTGSGDNVQKVFDLTALTDVTSSFESTISKTNQIQQTASGTAGHVLQIFLQPNS